MAQLQASSGENGKQDLGTSVHRVVHHVIVCHLEAVAAPMLVLATVAFTS